MQIQQNISLKPYNTFGINVHARYFASFTSNEQLLELLEYYKTAASNYPLLVLGGGSNLLFTHDFDGLVLHNEITGITVTNEDAHYYYVRSAGGENWHQFVEHCIAHNYAGVENLSLIPGNVGASPMQNVGAYGVEIKDVFHSLEAVHIKDGAMVHFSREDCRFGYRDSVFKGKHIGEYVITAVAFKLKKIPEYNISYGAIQQELDRMGVQELSLRVVSQAVINIRKTKLPDPAVIGNAGSFFKNPTLSKAQFQVLQQEYPNIPAYPAAGNAVKVAAGWLIEQCGWKGYRKNDAGVHDKQALVLVNYGDAKGIDIYSLSTEIMHSVENRFGILLEREVNIV